MEVVFTPWRWAYIRSTNSKGGECVLCAYLHNSDELVVYRGRQCFIVMNKYPYNIGHVMIVPNRHVPSIADLSKDELSECSALLMAIIKALAKVLGIGYGDFDIGINIGRVAGAGIEEHVHIHIVPKPSVVSFKSIDVGFVMERTRELAGKLRETIPQFIS
ncbi:HIT domain-containing protein [Vulcanisaeta sp. JCM 16159]|uniref:HIT family protein n=1 Tax=Vulcanisaeta sp. JCM 16159 TaxID=1295371 RepID=UPI0006D0C8AD|nr:HIT domain-containing protein [Vulcanisaeta sp. JCM 16159]